MFNYIINGDTYTDFDDPNFPVNYPNMDPTTVGNWFVINKQKVFHNKGQLLGHGGWYIQLAAPESPVYLGEMMDGSHTVVFRPVKEDPILQFEGVITDKVTNETKIEHYESSKALRLGVGNLSTGSNYESYDRAPGVNTWLARSWIEGEKEELYFLVENREMLDSAAAYYDLPVPYNDVLKTILDTNLSHLRFKSYDLNNEGEGNFVEVVVASVVFKDDIATTLKLYQTTRDEEQ